MWESSAGPAASRWAEVVIGFPEKLQRHTFETAIDRCDSILRTCDSASVV